MTFGPHPLIGGGVTWGQREMQLASVNACVCLLADTIASLTLSAYKQDGQARVKIDPQPRLITDSPYPGLSWFDWLWMAMESMALRGNAFFFVTARGRDDRPTALMPLHPDTVSVEIPTTGMGWPEPQYTASGVEIRNNEDIVHIKRYPIAGQSLGLSPIQKLWMGIELGMAADRYGYAYFRDSANPSSVLESDQPLTDDQSKRIMQQWVSTYGGRRRPAVLSGGVHWKPIAINPEESQFLAVRKYQRGEIASIFRIPPHMIGDTDKSTSWGTGLEQQSIGFVTYTLRPWLTCIEQALTSLLPNGTFVKFNIDGLLRGDVKTRWEAYRLGRDAGVYSPNDIRAMEDLTPVEDGDGRIQPMNFVPLGWEPPEPTGPVGTQPEPDAEPEAQTNPQDEPPAGDEE